MYIKAMRIYVAGALSNRERTDRNPSKVVVDYIQNLSRMCRVASTIRRKGHFPYVPGLDFLAGVVDGGWEEKDYWDAGMAFLQVCEAVYVDSWSHGVELEVKQANLSGIPVYESLGDIPDAIKRE